MKLSKSNLYPGDSFYWWDRHGGLGTKAQLVGPTTVDLALYQPGWPGRPAAQATFHCGGTVPGDTPPGRYRLMLDDAPAATVTVRARPVRIEYGFQPGRWLTETPFACQPDHTYSGFGCTLTTTLANVAYRRPLIRPADNCTFEGFTFLQQPGDFVFGVPDTKARNVTVRHCTFIGGSFGYWSGMDGLVVEHCRFVNASAAPVVGGLWINNVIEGPSLGPDPEFDCPATLYPLALLGLTMRGCARGLNLRPSWGDVSDALFCGVSLDNIDGPANAGELLNTEGKPEFGFHRNLFFNVRSVNSPGPWQFETEAHGNGFDDLNLENSAGVYLLGRVPQTGNEFFNVQLVGGQFYFGPEANNNSAHVAIVHQPPNRKNQHDVEPRYYVPQPAIFGAERQTSIRPKLVGFPEWWPASVGVDTV